VLILDGMEDLKARVGKELGVSEWRELTQEQVNLFADLTGDHQPIHTDPEAARRSRFGGTIAHGYHTLALGGGFSSTLYGVAGFEVVVNYGLNRVRFPAPLKVGDRVRMAITLRSVAEVPGGVEMITEEVFEVGSGGKPVCVAEVVTRLYAG
jgi:acyl dehydratase